MNFLGNPKGPYYKNSFLEKRVSSLLLKKFLITRAFGKGAKDEDLIPKSYLKGRFWGKKVIHLLGKRGFNFPKKYLKISWRNFREAFLRKPGPKGK